MQCTSTTSIKPNTTKERVKTMIVTNVTSQDFHNAFNAIRPNQFSYDALNAMFEYFEQYSEDRGEPFELDVIAVCCEWAEYNDLYDLVQDYPDIESLEDLHDTTTVLELPNEGLLILQF